MGLGEQYGSFMMSLQDDKGEEYIAKMITREVFDLSEWYSKLIEFDKSFYKYFEMLISWILPSGFSKASINFTDYPNYLIHRKDFAENELESYEEKFREFYLR